MPGQCGGGSRHDVRGRHQVDAREGQRYNAGGCLGVGPEHSVPASAPAAWPYPRALHFSGILELCQPLLIQARHSPKLSCCGHFRPPRRAGRRRGYARCSASGAAWRATPATPVAGVESRSLLRPRPTLQMPSPCSLTNPLRHRQLPPRLPPWWTTLGSFLRISPPPRRPHLRRQLRLSSRRSSTTISARARSWGASARPSLARAHPPRALRYPAALLPRRVAYR